MEERFHKSEFHNKSLVEHAHARLFPPPISEEILSSRENRVVTNACVCFNTAHFTIQKTRE